MTSVSSPDLPWLSVAMPVHRGNHWLAATLRSLAAQDCTGVEFVILDSTEDDSCSKIVERFADQLDMRYEHMPHTRSWTAKTNLAVERAQANHVSMLHQDDLWLPSRADSIRQAIAAFPEASMLLNPSFIVDESGRRLGLWRCPLPTGRMLSASKVVERLLVQNFIAIPSPVIRRNAWLAAGGMDEELWYTPDWDLYLKIIQAGPTVYLREPTTAFRVHGSSLTVSGSRDRSDFAAQMNTVLNRHIGLVPSARREQVRRRATASIAVNCQLAEAATGSATALFKALSTMLFLGPAQAFRYLRDSRIVERSLPRLRARLAGSL